MPLLVMDGGLRSSTGATALIWLSGGRTVDFVTVRVVSSLFVPPCVMCNVQLGKLGCIESQAASTAKAVSSAEASSRRKTLSKRSRLSKESPHEHHGQFEQCEPAGSQDVYEL